MDKEPSEPLETDSKLVFYLLLSVTIVFVVGIVLHLTGLSPSIGTQAEKEHDRVALGQYYYLFVSLG